MQSLLPYPIRIDVQLVAMGYLVSPDGRWRHVPHLDLIARDTLHLGARVYWGMPKGSESGCAYLWTLEIVLAPVLFEHMGYVIRSTWSHELGHLVTGRRSEEAARAWQMRNYAPLLEPAMVWA